MSDGDAVEPPSIHPSMVTRAVVLNQLLWTAGYSLTSGGFLLYFANELGARGFTTSVLLALPELVGVSAIGTRPLVAASGRRKLVWGATGLLARAASLGIPLMAFPALRPAGAALPVLIAALAVSQFLQAISYVAYLSWLSDLVPARRWGRFFATRTVSRIAVQLVVPIAAGYARDAWKRGLSSDEALLAYVAAFLVGTLLLLASMVPVLRLPEVSPMLPEDGAEAERPTDRAWSRPGYGGSLWLLLIHNWWLALANGLTQAAFYKYRVGTLGISLGTYYVLENTTLLVMVPISILAGRFSDRRGNKWLLFWGAVVASLALPFWFVATRDRWWLLFGAQVLWGAFAAVNLAGYNLLLLLSPRGRNTLQLALFQQGGGLLAGLSGLAGGWWLDRLLDGNVAVQVGPWTLGPFALLFAVSWAGRLTAPLWVLPIREPAKPSS